MSFGKEKKKQEKKKGNESSYINCRAGDLSVDGKNGANLPISADTLRSEAVCHVERTIIARLGTNENINSGHTLRSVTVPRVEGTVIARLVTDRRKKMVVTHCGLQQSVKLKGQS